MEIQRKIHLFKDTVRVQLPQVVQLTLVRTCKAQFVENIPFQMWIQLLPSPTFTLQRLGDVEDESALGLFCSSFNP